MREPFEAYLYSADRQGSLLLGLGDTEEEAMADARREIEDACLDIEPGSTIEVEEVECPEE